MYYLFYFYFYFLILFLFLFFKLHNYMWGNILTEVSYMQNFNMSFSNNKADILIHLTQ